MYTCKLAALSANCAGDAAAAAAGAAGAATRGAEAGAGCGYPNTGGAWGAFAYPGPDGGDTPGAAPATAAPTGTAGPWPCMRWTCWKSCVICTAVKVAGGAPAAPAAAPGPVE